MYQISMYVSICQYWNEAKYVWSQDGCEVSASFFFFKRRMNTLLSSTGGLTNDIKINGMFMQSFDYIRKRFLCSTELDQFQDSFYEVQKVT